MGLSADAVCCAPNSPHTTYHTTYSSSITRSFDYTLLNSISLSLSFTCTTHPPLGQLSGAGILVLLWDQVLAAGYGVHSSGVSVFIAANVCTGKWVMGSGRVMGGRWML